jgi:hypothetical protein
MGLRGKEFTTETTDAEVRGRKPVRLDSFGGATAGEMLKFPEPRFRTI